MSEHLRVGIIMGSQSDLGVMVHAGQALSQLGLVEKVDYEMRILSAHRTAERMMEYAATAEERGLRTIIAGAGGSAHLPGMVASETLVPVLGVAINTKLEPLNKAVGSMIGMPKGKPLATFEGVSGAFNAGLFCAKILLAHEPALREAYRAYESGLRDDVIATDEMLQSEGSEKYLEYIRRTITPTQS